MQSATSPGWNPRCANALNRRTEVARELATSVAINTRCLDEVDATTLQVQHFDGKSR
jgi:hypothetical protein